MSYKGYFWLFYFSIFEICPGLHAATKITKITRNWKLRVSQYKTVKEGVEKAATKSTKITKMAKITKITKN